MCGPVFLTSPLLSEPYGFEFTIVILNRRLLGRRRPLIMFLIRTRTRRQPKTEGADGEADIELRLCLNSAAIFIRMAPAGEQSTGLFSFQPRVKPILN